MEKVKKSKPKNNMLSSEPLIISVFNFL